MQSSLQTRQTELERRCLSHRLTATNNLNVIADGSAYYLGVQNQAASTDETSESSRFWGFNVGHSEYRSSQNTLTGLPTYLQSEADIISLSGGDQLLQGTQVRAGGTPYFLAGQGENGKADARIILAGLTSTVQTAQTKESNYVVWQRQTGQGSTIQTLALPTFTGGNAPVFVAPGGLTVQIPQSSDFKTQIQTLASQPGMGYLNDLTLRNDVNWQPVKLAYEQWSYKQEGLTPAGAALVAVAVAWAVGPAGSNLLGQALGAAPGAFAGAAANAAFTSLVAQASITFINNKGNIGKTLSDLSKSNLVKAAVSAALTAGALQQIGVLPGMSDLANGSFADKLTFNMINATGRALTTAAINGGDVESALKDALLGGLVDTAHGEVAGKIKLLEREYVAHTLAHALAGCVAGAAAGGACKDGALGAAIAEVVARMMPPANGIAYSEAEKAKVLAYGKLIAGGAVAYNGGNAQTAITTAETALQNNALVPLIVGLAWLADKAWTAYEVSQDIAAIRDGTKTVEQVAKEKGEEYVTGIIIGNVGRYGVKAVKTAGTWVQGKTVGLSSSTRGVGSVANNIYSDMKPIDSVFPELKGINPHYLENAAIGVNTNCVSCVNAAQERLTGKNAAAIASPSSGYANQNALLPSAPFGFGEATTPKAVVAEMLQAGNGAARALIIQQNGVDHVINVANKNGQVYFIDTQIGVIVALKPNVVVKLGNAP